MGAITLVSWPARASHLRLLPETGAVAQPSELLSPLIVSVSNRPRYRHPIQIAVQLE